LDIIQLIFSRWRWSPSLPHDFETDEKQYQ
jgi:hypothetical protein